MGNNVSGSANSTTKKAKQKIQSFVKEIKDPFAVDQTQNAQSCIIIWLIYCSKGLKG